VLAVYSTTRSRRHSRPRQTEKIGRGAELLGDGTEKRADARGEEEKKVLERNREL
jgi:hypothetical protein